MDETVGSECRDSVELAYQDITHHHSGTDRLALCVYRISPLVFNQLAPCSYHLSVVFNPSAHSPYISLPSNLLFSSVTTTLLPFASL
jgi:hypothetical protein